MAGIAEINAAFDAAEVQISETEGVEASASGLIQLQRTLNNAQAAEIQALKDQLAAGSPVTEADLDALLARAQAISQRLDSSEQSLAAAVAENPEPV